jgi:hypothetical protein
VAGRSDLAVIIGARTDQLASDLARGGSMIRNFARDASASTAGFARQALSTAAGFGVYNVAARAVSGLADSFRDAVRMAADLEQVTLSFEVMLGSAEKATKLVGDLRKFAAETPFNSADTIQAAKQLMAYGIASDEVVKTLRVLGDVTSGVGADLSHVAYVYGTLASQGRAFSKDIYQFTNIGIDLLPGLAKEFGKSTGEVMKLVEEGRVGLPQVGRALEALRGPGGRFANMMQRQSQTAKGLFEIARDAFDIAKTKFGQIVIDEMGLKDAARDFEQFGKRLEAGMDRVRPLVKFVGELGRAVVQVGYELGRAAINAAEFGGSILRAGFPEAAKAADSFRQMVRDAANFKVDPLVVNDLFFGAAKALTEVLAKALDGIAAMGEALRDNLVFPVQKAAATLVQAYVRVKEFAGTATPEERFRPPEWWERDADLLSRYRAMDAEIVGIRTHLDRSFPLLDPAKPDGPRVASIQMAPVLAKHEAEMAGLVRARAAFMAAVVGGDDWRVPNAAFKEGRVPPIKGRDDVLLGPGGAIRQQAQGLRNAIPAMEAERNVIAERIRVESLTAAMRKAFGEMFAASRRAASQAGAVRDAGLGRHLLGALGPDGAMLGALQSARSANALRAGAGVVGGLLPGAELARQNAGRLVFPDKASQPAIELANRLKEQFRPLEKLAVERGFLQEALRHGLIDKAEFNLGDRQLVQDLADRLGVGAAHLPTGPEKDTAEAVRALNQWAAGRQNQTTEQLLEQIRRILEETKRIAEGRARDDAGWFPWALKLAP